MKFAIIGFGYVGSANAAVLSTRCEVSVYDRDPGKAAILNDESFLSFYAENGCPLPVFASSLAEAVEGASHVLFALPTDFDEATGAFDVADLRECVKEVHSLSPDAVLVVKSTVPVGFCKQLQEALPSAKILYSPEFLREKSALADVLFPSRIVVGTGDSPEFKRLGEELATLFRLRGTSTPVVLCSHAEAEAIKLFSNTYLAMRVSFFNELDSFALSRGLDAKSIIAGVCLDPRIGDHYNNPSVGYGGYCLPKDSKQLLRSFDGIAQELIGATVQSNQTRKAFVVSEVLAFAQARAESPVIGIYRLNAGTGTKKIRNSPLMDVISLLLGKGTKVIVFEPSVPEIDGVETIADLDEFKSRCDAIVANRYDKVLDDVREKVFTRDIFGRD